MADFSFWSREFRDEWRDVVREEWEAYEMGVNIVLVFFDAEEEVLWKRIENRRVNAEREGRCADDAAVVTRAMLDRFVRGFERPDEDEKAIVIKVESLLHGMTGKYFSGDISKIGSHLMPHAPDIYLMVEGFSQQRIKSGSTARSFSKDMYFKK